MRLPAFRRAFFFSHDENGSKVCISKRRSQTRKKTDMSTVSTGVPKSAGAVRLSHAPKITNPFGPELTEADYRGLEGRWTTSQLAEAAGLPMNDDGTSAAHSGGSTGPRSGIGSATSRPFWNRNRAAAVPPNPAANRGSGLADRANPRLDCLDDRSDE
jgi:hypothetical protein